MTDPIQCPRCGAPLANDGSATLQCGKCGNSVLNPGAASRSDDDDWLNLDDTPIPTSNPGDALFPDQTLSPNQTPRPNQTLPPNQAGEGDSPNADGDVPLEVDGMGIVEVDPAEWSDPFDSGAPSEAELSSLPSQPPRQTAAPDGSTTPGGRPAGNSSGGTTSPTNPHQEYRLKCKVCDSITFVLPAQAGSVIECSDCHSDLIVPPPPTPKKKSDVAPGPATFSGSVPPAIPFAAAPPTASRPEDPFRKSANELLEEASRVEIEEPDDDFTVPSAKEWFASVLSILTDLSVVAHLAVFSVAGSSAAMLALATGHPAVMMILFPAAAIFGLIVLSSGFAILQSTASDCDQVEDWPTTDSSVWFENAVCTASATAISGAPAFALTTFIFGPNLVTAAVTMLSIFVLFPFVLLSILDNNTVLMPFSAEVARSVQTTQEPWGGLYFSSAILFAGLFFLYVIMGMTNPVGSAPVVVTATVTAVFLYFAMIGRLAFAIGQAVRQQDVDP